MAAKKQQKMEKGRALVVETPATDRVAELDRQTNKQTMKKRNRGWREKNRKKKRKTIEDEGGGKAMDERSEMMAPHPLTTFDDKEGLATTHDNKDGKSVGT